MHGSIHTTLVQITTTSSAVRLPHSRQHVGLTTPELGCSCNNSLPDISRPLHLQPGPSTEATGRCCQEGSGCHAMCPTQRSCACVHSCMLRVPDTVQCRCAAMLLPPRHAGCGRRDGRSNHISALGTHDRLTLSRSNIQEQMQRQMYRLRLGV